MLMHGPVDLLHGHPPIIVTIWSDLMSICNWSWNGWASLLHSFVPVPFIIPVVRNIRRALGAHIVNDTSYNNI
jgi:hypothetical protein